MDRDQAITKLEIEAARSDKALIGALSYLGTLSKPDFSDVEHGFQLPLMVLFGYSRERIKLGGRDRDLPEKIEGFFPNLPEASDWVSDTDLKHTVASFGFLNEITAKENFTYPERKIVLSAIIAHDCAYPKTKDLSAFRSADTRLSHMRDGEAEFRNFALKINSIFHGFYTPGDTEIVCSIIRQHDNPSVKIDGKNLEFSYNPPPEKLMWAHREADRLWMLDRGGFALDLARRILETDPQYNPSDYLKHVISSHLKEAEKYPDQEKCILYKGEKTLYRTKAGFEIFRRLLNERAKEYHITAKPSVHP